MGTLSRMNAPMQSRTTAAYFVQAVISFALATSALALGIAYLPVGAWMRAFLAVGLLYEITSAFTLAKVIRDRQEAGEITTRVDQARLEKLLAEHDPFKVEGI
ncbi:YiaA/YiaB family inner membrane protein [Kitasatospora atroaurantiaca]